MYVVRRFCIPEGWKFTGGRFRIQEYHIGFGWQDRLCILEGLKFTVRRFCILKGCQQVAPG